MTAVDSDKMPLSLDLSPRSLTVDSRPEVGTHLKVWIKELKKRVAVAALEAAPALDEQCNYLIQP